MEHKNLINLIKLSLWNEGSAFADETVYEEMKKHTIEALPGTVLLELGLSQQLLLKWKIDIVRQVNSYYTYEYSQHNLPITVPYVILKGTAASQYYPVPQYRAMGDIDIMTKHEDCDTVCDILLKNGYIEVTSDDDMERARHREFSKDGISIEVHNFFASMNDPVKAEIFDNLIIDNINDTHVLPDLVNGLVLIEHINQHLEEGLGLRQIIDWMMFVDKCLTDEKWPEFRIMARKTGLEQLAITATRMCEIYLGLKEHQWSKAADIDLCDTLMEYVVSCGNFGVKLSDDDRIAVGRASRLRDPIMLLRDMQKAGMENWDKAKYPFLAPFAWIWQGIQSAKRSGRLIKDYEEGKRIDRMLDDLGVKRNQRGLVKFNDGKYTK